MLPIFLKIIFKEAKFKMMKGKDMVENEPADKHSTILGRLWLGGPLIVTITFY